MIENKNKFISFCDKLSMVLFCIVMFDVAVFGAGRIVSFGPLSFRQVMLLLLGVSCIPLLIVNFKQTIKNKFIWAIIGFLIWFLISTIIGVKNGNRLVSMDFNGFLYLVFMPLALVVLNSKEKVNLLMKVMICGSAVLALITIAHLILYVCNKSVFDELAIFEIQIKFARISHISKSTPRIYMLSALYLIAGCSFSMYFLGREKVAWKKWGYIITVAISFFALLLSYTRSIYAGVLISAAVVFIYLFFSVSKKEKIKLISNICACVILFISICGAFSLTTGANYLGYAFSRSAVGMLEENPNLEGDESDPFGSDDDELDYYNQITLKSDKLRALTVAESIKYIKKSPIIGHGLGFTVPSRPDGNEYSYLDIWLKMGIIGLILYFLPIVLILINIFKTPNESVFSRKIKVMWFAALMGVMVYSLFNPYINSALGIFIYSCTMVISQNLIDKKTNVLEM